MEETPGVVSPLSTENTKKRSRGIYMVAYGSPELHPKLRNDPQPPKKKAPAILKRGSFWLCVICILLEVFFDDTHNVTGMFLACCVSVFICEGITLLINALRGHKAKTNAIAVIVSVSLYLAIAFYLGSRGQ